MKEFYSIGIDVSKKHLYCCLFFHSLVVRQDVISNHQKSIENFLLMICSEENIDTEQIVICAEYTGLYIYPLVIACQNNRCKLWLGWIKL